MHEPVLLGGALGLEELERVARGAPVALDPRARGRVERAADFVRAEVEAGRVHYGVTTGFGRNADRSFDGEERARLLQTKLILSHTAGVGPALEAPLVRMLVALRVHTLLGGHSGIRWRTLEQLVRALNAGLLPVVPRYGSVGASGDLAPLSHVVAALLGHGEAQIDGERMGGAAALERAGLEPLELTYKEGLALNNGTTLMAVLAAAALARLDRCLRLADVNAALCVEALAGRTEAFDARVHERLRPHPGQVRSAANLRALLAGSELAGIPLERVPAKGRRPQDPYSFRCAPQVHGAVRDAWSHARAVVERELGAVTDNPLIFPEEGEILSAGNFHGMPVALALSTLKCALPPLGAIGERRIATLVDDACSDGLPRFLSGAGAALADGLDSGLMLVQYSAAALVNELATRAHPATAYSIPTCANMEDQVSMGAGEGHQVLEMLGLLEELLALELLAAGQGADLRRLALGGEARLGVGTTAALAALRARVPFLGEDVETRVLIEGARALVAGGNVLGAVEAAVGRGL